MKMKQALAALVASSLAAAPAVAQAAVARTAAPVADAENVRGGFLIPAVAIIAILLGILAITSGDDDLPQSP